MTNPIKITAVISYPQGDKPTLNGRIYTKECLAKAVADAQQAITENKMLGYVGPRSDQFTRPLADVGFMVSDLSIDEAGVMSLGATILDTEKGAELRRLIGMQAENIHFVTRGTGIIKDGVVTDFELHGFDAIHKDDL